jgi:hypothetical protein
MQNISFSIDDEQILTIKINLKQSIGDSRSGRSEVLASTGGNLRLANSDGTFRDEIVNLSVTRRKPGTKARAWIL